MSKDLLILGAGGNALDVYDFAVREYNVLGFLDDSPEKQQNFSYNQHRILGPLSKVSEYKHAQLIFAIGSPRNHKQRLAILENLGLASQLDRFPVMIAPGVNISPSVKIGPGTILLSGCQVGAQAEIGNFVWGLQNCVFSHDCNIGSGTVVACGGVISGHVKAGQGCYLGAGAVIRDGLTISENTMVAAGAVVVSDISETGTYAGVPAKQMRQG